MKHTLLLQMIQVFTSTILKVSGVFKKMLQEKVFFQDIIKNMRLLKILNDYNLKTPSERFFYYWGGGLFASRRK